MYWHFKLLIENVLSPNTFVGKKEELETLKGGLNDSRQQLHLVEQVGLVKHVPMVTLGVWCCSSLCGHSSASEPCRAGSRDCLIAFSLLSGVGLLLLKR